MTVLLLAADGTVALSDRSTQLLPPIDRPEATRRQSYARFATVPKVPEGGRLSTSLLYGEGTRRLNATVPSGPSLGSIVIDDRDVPPGFELDVKQSGPYEQPSSAPSWLSPLTQHAARLHCYDRVWFHRQEHRAIIAQVVDYPIDKLASADAHSATQDFKK